MAAVPVDTLVLDKVKTKDNVDDHVEVLKEAARVRFEYVQDQTTEDYFNNNYFSIDAFQKKYCMHDDETYVQALKRVCDAIASVEEKEEDQQYWSEQWFDEIYNDWWHPAGSIMQGAGSGRNISLANCITVSLGSIEEDEEWDNLESIIRNTAYTVAKSAAFRQGLGVDFSALRPSGSKVLNSANESTGSVHWMKFIDSIGYYVGQSGRIPAFLFSLRCDHPDVEEFIGAKCDYTKVQNANISVQCTDKFYKAVENNDDWVLKFTIPSVKKGDRVYVDVHSASPLSHQQDENGRWYFVAKRDRMSETIKKTVKARKLMELISKNMCDHAEPGIQNIDIARRLSNSDYVYDENADYDSRVSSTNACSEQYLSRESCCILSSINCGRFSVHPELFDQELYSIGRSINRFLDNVNEYELQHHTYSTPHQKMGVKSLRRTGAGFTNAAGWLFKQQLEYGTEQANDALAHFTERYNYHLYASSIELGHEKGSFGLFNREKLERSPFIKRMMKLGLEFDALRNVTVSSIAPTGSLSLMFRDLVMSYGIEPSFGMYYWKRTRIAGHYEYYFNVPRVVRDMYAEAGYPIPIESDTIRDTWAGSKGKPAAEFIDKHAKDVGFVCKRATEVEAMDKLDLMSKVMEWIDSSISVTYMLPEGAKWKDVYDFIMEAHKRKVKSIAAFPDRKMYGIITYMPFKELALKLQADGIELHPQNFVAKELQELNMGKESMDLITAHAPKRPKSLPAEIFAITVAGEKFVVAVGLYNGYPYEIFGGHMNGLDLKKRKMNGTLTKECQGKYSLEFNDILIDDFSHQFTPVEKILFRTLSMSLRHGIPIEFIVDQLTKSTDDIASLSAAITRVLKKYIKDGQKVPGQICPSCGANEVVYMDGCVTCARCPWSLCS